MAKARKRGRGIDATGRSKGAGRFILLDHGMLNTEAWASLSPDASKVLIDLWLQHNGSNNGAIGYSQRAAHACLCKAHGKKVTRDRATVALREIQDKGFAVVVRDSIFALKTKEAREWRLTAEDANGQPPTREFKTWRAQDVASGSRKTKHGHSPNA